MYPLVQDPNGTVQAAPWWGTPLIAGGFLIIGALIALISAWATKGRELARADRARWDETILSTCSKLTEFADRLWMDYTPDSKWDGSRSTDPIAKYRPELEKLNEERWRLEFIASVKLNHAASALVQQCWMLLDGKTTTDRVLAGADIMPKADDLRDCARAELRANK